MNARIRPQVTMSGASRLQELAEQLRELGASVVPLETEGLPSLIVGYGGKTTLLDVQDAPTRSGEPLSGWKGSGVKDVATLTQACQAMGLRIQPHKVRARRGSNKPKAPKPAPKAKAAPSRKRAA